MSLSTPTAVKLIADPEALALYQGRHGPGDVVLTNWFHTLVDLVESRERAGLDPIPAIRTVLVAMCKVDADRQQRFLELVATQVYQPLIFTEEKTAP